MRRLFGLMAVCGLVALLGTGCDHTAGVCDCDPGYYHGYGYLGGDPGPAAIHAPAIHLEPAPAPTPTGAMSKATE
jgi:hypothetical protein